MNTVRAEGLLLTVGATVWAMTMLIAPPHGDTSATIEILGGLAFQVGLAGFLTAVRLTGAAGTGRSARIVFAVEAVLLAAAAIWSVVYAINPATQAFVGMKVLDAAWPLSMLGLIPVAVVIWRAGVWRGPLRRLPLLASLWLPLDIAATVIGGNPAGLAFRAAWLIVVWGALGILIARNAAATGDADGAASPEVGQPLGKRLP